MVTGRGPALAGYRIVEFSSAVAAPQAGHMLADMGAEVIKVESRVRLDGQRLGRPRVPKEIAGEDREQWIELMPFFHALNRNKLSVAINIREPLGVGLILELVRCSDAVVENFAPGVLERHGLGYTALQAAKPDIVVVSMPGPGSWGPLCDLITYAGTISALTGWDSLSGYDDGTLTAGGVSPDAIGAMHGALAVLMALHHRNRTGRGQHVEMAEWEASTSLLGEAILAHAMNGQVYGPRGNDHPTMAPHGNYPCRGEDQWVAIAVGSEEEWRRLCSAMGDPLWTQDPRFADQAGRVSHRKELDRCIGEWTRERNPSEVGELLQGVGVAATPVLTIAEQTQDPHHRERDLYVEVVHPRVGKEIIYGTPFKLSETPGSVRRSGPLLGEHNDYVLREILHQSQEDIDRLVAAGVLS